LQLHLDDDDCKQNQEVFDQRVGFYDTLYTAWYQTFGQGLVDASNAATPSRDIMGAELPIRTLSDASRIPSTNVGVFLAPFPS